MAVGRKRIGLLIPSSNSVMEVDFYTRLPADRSVTLHTGRMYMEETTPEGEAAMLDRYALPAAKDVGTARPHVIVFGCTSAGALRGNDYDRELCARIAAAAGCPAISVIASVRSAMARRGARRVGVVTPYVEGLNEKIKASIEADGVEVVAIHGLGITENFAIAEVIPAEIADFCASRLKGLRIDLAFISCTNFRALEAIPEVEARLGVPAISSNQAALEATWEAIA